MPREIAARDRVLDGFAAAIARSGYAAATIAEIVRAARVSKRTFYEHFPDKEACLLAAYETATRAILAAMQDAFAAHEGDGWLAQLEAALDAYVTALEENPRLTRTCLVEMLAAGPRARKLRREVHAAFGDALCAFVDAVRARDPEVRPISAPLALALVAGIDELLLAQVERGPQHRLADLRRDAFELLHAVLARPAPPRDRRRV